jgi:hypothetical protein
MAREDTRLPHYTSRLEKCAQFLSSMTIKTVLQLLIEFPNMRPEEKQIHYDCLKGDIERQRVQEHQDCSKVLGELKRILD